MSEEEVAELVYPAISREARRRSLPGRRCGTFLNWLMPASFTDWKGRVCFEELR